MCKESQDFIQEFLIEGGGGRGEEHLGDLSKRFDMGGGGGSQACLIDIMTSEIQKVSANELLLNKFQLSKC